MPTELRLLAVVADGPRFWTLTRILDRTSLQVHWTRARDRAEYLQELDGYADQVKQFDVILAHEATVRTAIPDLLEVARERVAGLPVVVVGGELGHAAQRRLKEEGAGAYVPATRMRALGRYLRRLRREPGVGPPRPERLPPIGQALTDRVNEIHQLIWSIPDRVWIKGPDLRFLYVNHAMARSLRSSPEEMQGRTDCDVWGPTMGARFQEEDRRHMKAGRATFVRRGPTENIKIPLAGQDGRPAALVIITSDPGQWSRAEHMLSNWACMVVTSGDAIVGLKPNGEVQTWNPGAEAMYGYSLHEMRGRSIAELSSPEGRQELTERVRGVFTERTVHRYDAVHVTADGRPVDVSLTVSPLVSPNGESFGVSVFARDITERVRTEDELRRTLEQLRRSNTELEQYARVVSSDLREPIRTLIGCLDGLGPAIADDGEGSELIGRARSAASRLHRLVDDLSAFSMVGRPTGPSMQVDCEEALRAALADLAPAIEAEGATVTHDPLPVVPGRRAEVAQLFRHLVHNALRFRSPEPPRIHVGSDHEDGGPVFRVEDNGMGVRPEEAERIFDVFQRGRPGPREGTGIGLAICRKIVEGYGGRIWVEGGPEGGSAFFFTLSHGGETPLHRERIEQVARAVRHDPRNEFDFAAAAERLHMSYRHFHRLFRRYIGRPPNGYLLLCRMRRAARSLRNHDHPVKAVARQAGYANPAHFTRAFKRVMGMTPRQFRESAPVV